MFALDTPTFGLQRRVDRWNSSDLRFVARDENDIGVVLFPLPHPRLANEISNFRNVGLKTLEKGNVKKNPSRKDSGWNISFWFAVLSPLIGIALTFAAAAVMKIYEDSGAAIEAISQFDFGHR